MFSNCLHSSILLTNAVWQEKSEIIFPKGFGIQWSRWCCYHFVIENIVCLMTPRLLEVSANSIGFCQEIAELSGIPLFQPNEWKGFFDFSKFIMSAKSFVMHTFITVCYIATLDANLNCLFKLQWRYTLHIKFPLVPRCHVVINLPILMSARQKQHLLGEWWCGVRSLKWLLNSLCNVYVHGKLRP